jgi:hypothetical protein
MRFKKLENRPLDLIGASIASLPVDELVARAKAARSEPAPAGRRRSSDR